MAKNGCTKLSYLFFESDTLTHHSTIMGRSSKKGGAAQVKLSAAKEKKAKKAKAKQSPPRASSRNKTIRSPTAIAGVKTADFLRHLEDNPGTNVLASPTTNVHVQKAQRLLLEVSCLCA